MRIGAREVGRIFLAPLSGVADSPFRRVCKGFGAEVVYSEMVSSVGLSKENWRSRALMNFHEEERPIGVQLFGREPGFMAGATALAEEARPDLLDLNLSCPASKIVSRGAGAALLREPERIKQIARAVVGAATLPVTAKIRIGWDGAHLNAVEVARILEGEGIQAISVHGRTFEQGFSGRASWEAVAEVKRAVAIPVVLSGDVAAPPDAQRAFAETGCDALMVGRGSFGRPWVFAAIRDHLEGKPYAGPSHRDVAEVALRHLDLGIEEFGERIAVTRFRKHLLWYTKGMYGVVRLRAAMCKVTTREDVAGVLEQLSEHPWQTSGEGNG
jgi:tRNA-dihydrouridine synthase B